MKLLRYVGGIFLLVAAVLVYFLDGYDSTAKLIGGLFLIGLSIILIITGIKDKK